MLTTIYIKRTIITESKEILGLLSGERTQHPLSLDKAMVILVECKLFKAVVVTVLILQFHSSFVRSKPATESKHINKASRITHQPEKIQQSNESKLNSANVQSMRIEALKQNILKRLGLKSVPSVSRLNMSIERQRQKIQEYRNYLVSQGETEYIPDTDEINTIQEKNSNYPGLTRKSAQRKRRNLLFKVSLPHPDDPFFEALLNRATLTLYKNDKLTSFNNKNVTINVFKYIYQNNGVPTGNISLLQSIDLTSVHTPKYVINVTEIVQEWIDKQVSQQELIISCDNHVINNLLYLGPTRTQRNQGRQRKEKQPAIKVSWRQVPILHRHKRYVDGVERKDCTVGDGYKNCCRFKTRVNFKEIGWTFVKAPPVYEAYYCEGACPVGHKMASTFTGIKANLHELYPEKFSGACCVPSSYKPLTLLHEDEHGSLTFSSFSDMVVQDCTCA